MRPRKILVHTPARLHFGLFSFGNAGRQFGGVGVMIQEPSVRLAFEGADCFVADGEHADCVSQAAASWMKGIGTDRLPNCRVRVLAAPQRHVGLGSGTQLSLAVVTGLCAWQQLPRPEPFELARLAGRGRRSAVGTYGFAHGGLIVEPGKTEDELLAPLGCRMAFPQEWRLVLVRVGGAAGLYGSNEFKAFAKLPPVSGQCRAELVEEVELCMLPALRAQDCRAFGESLYRYGCRAGACFASIQGGPFNGEQVAAMVAELRSLGVVGVGQSSWGPTLFCVMPSKCEAESLARELKARHAGEDLDVCITAADNQGARLTEL